MKKLFTMLPILTLGAIPLVGCGEKDSDPNAKVDTPGYYNGEMKPKGAGAGGPPPANGQKAKPGVGKDD